MLKHIRSHLIMGLVVLLPTILTLYVLGLLFTTIDRILGGIISNILVILRLIPRFPIELPLIGLVFEDRIPGIGFVVAIFLLIFVGYTTKSFIGKQMIKLTELFFYRIPIARSIYSTVQQITSAFTQDKTSFKRVVLVEYPRKGLYTMGFLTGESQFANTSITDLINVFLPTTPNPTSGWLALVPARDVTFLEMSVEDGLKYIISGGVVNPQEIIETSGNGEKSGEEESKEQEQ